MPEAELQPRHLAATQGRRAADGEAYELWLPAVEMPWIVEAWAQHEDVAWSGKAAVLIEPGKPGVEIEVELKRQG